ncbi:mitochondrial cardiolipin hydrolase [Topomyia yanbarensis]|uniref:mitochondrial cardiolipin hydrolase n=1 Tax=Topomyia yanbarensis TaxID=2498891 RepID=UPI00273C7D3C|nr:mitochondrial cardiolipin hydrolase [Topomyia yanbarensis]XP_058820981.1 mitochondrial cardiolipin hydrolase [Topomyia yanbarensis]XP_058820989.1 mitochondrial cardiolipin hydrolase [Topomyia yanbarensis]
MFSSSPQWVRVSAAVVAVTVSSEALYELYIRWRSYCARRRARQLAASHWTDVFFANERSIHPNEPGTTMASFTTEHVRRLVALIDRARVSINLCMYIVTVESIGDAVLRAAKRGVKVRVVGCSSMAYSSGSQMTKLVHGGIPVRFNKQNSAYLMHHKFCLIDTDWLCPQCYHSEKVRRNGFCCDAPAKLSVNSATDAAKCSVLSSVSGTAGDSASGSANGSPTYSGSKVQCSDNGSRCVRCDPKLKRSIDERKVQDAATDPFPLGGIVISGSTNWTMQALSSNWDNMVLTSLPELVVPFQMEFQRLWKEFARLPPLISGAEAAGSVATGSSAGNGVKQ